MGELLKSSMLYIELAATFTSNIAFIKRRENLSEKRKAFPRFNLP